MVLSPLLPGFSSADAVSTASVISAKDYGAAGDGIFNDYGPITRAAADAITSRKTLHFSPGRYYVSQAIIILGATKLHITGDGATICTNSSGWATAGADYDSSPSAKGSGLYLKRCSNVSVCGLYFEGDYEETDVFVNGGTGLSLRNCENTRIYDCEAKWGGGIISQTALASGGAGIPEDTGTILSHCHIDASRGAARLGNNSWFVDCHWAVPYDDATFDRVGNFGSSHAVYFFASSGQLSGALDCTFKGVRVDSFKVSGSASPLTTFVVANCVFERCGLKSDGTSNGGSAILMGADNIQFHNHLSAYNNTFRDCNGEISIYGSRSVVIDGANIYMTAAPTSGVKTAFIAIARYPSNPAGGPSVGQPDNQCVETVSIRNVTISADPTIGGGGNAIAIAGISIADVGDVDSTYDSSVSMSNIDVSYCATTAISTARCVAPTFRGIKATGLVTALSLNGDCKPWVSDLHVVKPQSNNAQIKQTDVSWPIYDQLYGAGTIGASGNGGKVGIGDNAGGTASVEYSLRGVDGFAYPTESKPEVVFAFGSNLTPAGTVNIGKCSNDPTDAAGTITLTVATDTQKFRVGQRFFASPNSNASSPRTGTATVVSKTTTTVTFSGTVTGITTNDFLFQAADTFDMASIIFTYVSSGANSTTTFTTAAQLMACIAATTFWTASDYGSFRSPAVTTNHIRIRNATTSTTANVFYARSFCYRPTALVFLFNSGSAYDRTSSRGENADRFVVWSPCYQISRPPVISPANVAAQTTMSGFRKFTANLVAAVTAADGTGAASLFKSTLLTALAAMTPPKSTPVRLYPLPDAGDPGASCTFACEDLQGGAVGTGEEFAWRC